MAQASVKLPQEFIEGLASFGAHEEEVVAKTLIEGANAVLPQVKSNLAQVLGSPTKFPKRQTGALASALGLSKPLPSRTGDWDIKIGFAENRADGAINAVLANVLEYGSYKSQAKPFLGPAVRAKKKAALAAMEKVLEDALVRYLGGSS